uniref:BESS domain-containing protein n=2 Tax=Schizaphis graminum TaxID=13262 RepID=A0A2S2NMX0_SCHGA
MENSDSEERQQPSHKKFKKNAKTENFGSSLLKILENRQRIPEDPEKSFLMSLLPQIKSLDEDQKTQLYVEFLNAIQRVKNSPVTSTYTYNTPNNQPYSQFYPQQNYATNNYPHSPSPISYQRPLSRMSQFNITPHQYSTQNVPKNIISSTITSPPSVNDESSNFSQPSTPEMYSTHKPNYYNI